MAKTYLTEEELDQFPTIEELITDIGESAPCDWGLCQNQFGELAIAEECQEWELLMSLPEILSHLKIRYGEHPNPREIYFFYGILNYKTVDHLKEGRVRPHIHFDFISSPYYQEEEDTTISEEGGAPLQYIQKGEE